MREFALTDMERAGAFEDAERTFQMTEEAFRVFYDQTARPVWLYLARTTGDDRLADDLLQETYYRFLRTRTDVRERRSSPSLPVPHRHQSRRGSVAPRSHRCRRTQRGVRRAGSRRGQRNVGDRALRRIDLTRALEQLKPRERTLLWLAYAQGFSHEEIASQLGLQDRQPEGAALSRAPSSGQRAGRPLRSGGRP